MKPGKEKGEIILDRDREYYIAMFALDALDVDIHWGLSQFVGFEGSKYKEGMTADETDILLLALRKFSKNKNQRPGRRKLGRWMINEIKSTLNEQIENI